MTRKNKKDRKKKGSRGRDSESSTPQSSTASGGDETRPLLQGGAHASRDSSESTPSPKSRGWIGQRTTPYQSLGATSSTNIPQSGHSSRTDRFAGPDTASSSSPSKSLYKLLPDILKPKKSKSPNRPSGSECRCEDKENHQPDCPEFKNISAEEKDETGGAKQKTPIPSTSTQPSSTLVSKKSEDGAQSSSSSDPSVADYSRGATESEQINISADAKGEYGGAQLKEPIPSKSELTSTQSSSSSDQSAAEYSTGATESEQRNIPADARGDFGGAKPKKPIPRKLEPTTNEDGTQSSSSSDPSVADYSRGATEFEEPSEKSLLLVPDQGAGVHSTSPSKKKSPLKTRIKELFKSTDQSSDAEGNSDDKTDSERELPKQGKNKAGVKNKPLKGKSQSSNQKKSEAPSGSGSSTPKKNKTASSSKSGRSNSKSSSDLDPNVEVCSGKGKGDLKRPSGTESSSKSKSDTESSGSLLDADPPGATSSVSARCGDMAARRDVDQQQRPHSSKSASSRSPNRVPFHKWAKLPKIKDLHWPWLDSIMRGRRSDPDVDIDPAVNTPDGEEQDRLDEVDDVRRDSTVRRHESSSRVRLEQMISRWNLERRGRALNRRDGNERRLPRHIEESGSSSETERHTSHSPNLRVRPCTCRGRTGRDGVKCVFNHEVACPQQIDLRQRRKKRRCRQAAKKSPQ